MANWCSNYLTFSGDNEKVNKALRLFELIAEQQTSTGEAQKPFFVQEMQEGYFFDISVEDDAIYYETRWSPNVKDVTAIAKYYGLSYVLCYEEMSSSVYGKAIFKAGSEQPEELDLLGEDFDKYESDEESGLYSFRGEVHESRYDILAVLFQERHNVEY